MDKNLAKRVRIRKILTSYSDTSKGFREDREKCIDELIEAAKDQPVHSIMQSVLEKVDNNGFVKRSAELATTMMGVKVHPKQVIQIIMAVSMVQIQDKTEVFPLQNLAQCVKELDKMIDER